MTYKEMKKKKKNFAQIFYIYWCNIFPDTGSKEKEDIDKLFAEEI